MVIFFLVAVVVEDYGGKNFFEPPNGEFPFMIEGRGPSSFRNQGAKEYLV